MKRLTGVRALMIAVAVVAAGSAYVATRWRRGEFAFQRRHHDLAGYCDTKLRWIRAIRPSFRQASPNTSAAVTARREAFCRELDELERAVASEARWHHLIAGPSFDPPVPDSLIGHGPLNPRLGMERPKEWDTPRAPRP